MDKPDKFLPNGTPMWQLFDTAAPSERHDLSLYRHGPPEDPRWATYETNHREISEEEALVLLARFGRARTTGTF